MSPMLVSLMFALRLGTFVSHADRSDLAIRAEAVPELDQALVSSFQRFAPISGLDEAPHAPMWAEDRRVGPVFHPYQPEEWISHMARELNLEGKPIAHAAMWIASAPVRFDISDRRLYVSVRLKTF